MRQGSHVAVSGVRPPDSRQRRHGRYAPRMWVTRVEISAVPARAFVAIAERAREARRRTERAAVRVDDRAARAEAADAGAVVLLRAHADLHAARIGLARH